MHDIDFERAALLMSVIKDVTNVSPMDTNILGEAQQELREINELCKENARERAEERAAEEAANAPEQPRVIAPSDGNGDEEVDDDDDDDNAPVRRL
jgi:hypothetical protein